MHAWVRIDPAPGSPDFAQFEVAGLSYSFYNGSSSSDAETFWPLPRTWISVDSAFLGNIYPAKLTDVVLHVAIYANNWKGTVYVDDVRIY